MEIPTRFSEAELERPAGIPEDAILRVLRVAPEQAGMRLDVFVQSQLRNTSRTRARAIVESGAFTPDGRRLRPNDRVRAEDRVVLWRKPFEEDALDSSLPILYEDEALLVIDKPPFVAVHPSARYYRSTLIKRLAAQRPGEYLALVHRLDRETSGIVLVARSLEADRAFKRAFEERSLSQGSATVRKTYLAITWGVPEPGLVARPLELDPTSALRVKMRIAEPGQGLEARTRLEILETKKGYALVACELETGRQHQIRVHLASLGCPVVGDKLYGPDERILARAADRKLLADDLVRLELPRHALHAHRYRLTHALSGQPLDLISPLPADLKNFWDCLDEA